MKKLKVEELHRLSPDRYALSGRIPLVLVLDSVRSMHNVGSIFRTADAFAVECICLCGITSTPPHAEIHKTALGAEEVVAWKYYSDAVDCVKQLRAEGYVVAAVEQTTGSRAPQEVAWGERPLAVVFGHEVRGVSQQVVDMCDLAIEIPQYGTKHSLNVSVAAGIVMWEACRALAGTYLIRDDE